jgi:predicted RNase H-like HicB family nuclease
LTYSVTLERGGDGSYLAWVHELPGCFARGATRDAAIANTSAAVAHFRDWLREAGERVDEDEIRVVVADEVESVIEADEDTEVLVPPDREPLTEEDWQTAARWLAHSRRALLRALAGLSDEELERRVEGRDRTIREQLIHIAFVELMYAAWTFDLDSRDGLADFLAWTRAIASDRIALLAEREDGSLTHAEWAGAPRREAWTARKATRRLIWHELLHLPEVGG